MGGRRVMVKGTIILGEHASKNAGLRFLCRQRRNPNEHWAFFFVGVFCPPSLLGYFLLLNQNVLVNCFFIFPFDSCRLENTASVERWQFFLHMNQPLKKNTKWQTLGVASISWPTGVSFALQGVCQGHGLKSISLPISRRLPSVLGVWEIPAENDTWIPILIVGSLSTKDFLLKIFCIDFKNSYLNQFSSAEMSLNQNVWSLIAAFWIHSIDGTDSTAWSSAWEFIDKSVGMD